MNWREKVEKIKELLQYKPELQVVFDIPERGAPPDFLNQLRTNFPFIPDEYANFLKAFDGIQLDMFVLFGSGKSDFPSFESELQVWDGIIDFNEFIPIGKDASGDTFIIDKAGRLYIISGEPPYDQQYLTNTLDNLINDYFLGNKYLSLFPSGRSESEWLELLRDEHWIE